MDMVVYWRIKYLKNDEFDFDGKIIVFVWIA